MSDDDNAMRERDDDTMEKRLTSAMRAQQLADAGCEHVNVGRRKPKERR